MPSEAEACGGTFCDGGLPGNMPVQQTGETILFALDNGFVEAHVQIEYEGGDADQFAWLVPVPELPEIEVGSWRLVQAALTGTSPIYGFEDNWVCEDDPPAPPGGSGGVGFIRDPDGGGTSSEPDVIAEDVVGAFDFVVLQGGTSETIVNWLSTNGYAPNAEAPTILDEYIDEGALFVAFRLRHGQGTDDIHPVVIRYPGTEPCIPLRLTRVAAQEDMEIRALFLGEARVVPTNYRHVLLNRTRLNWLGLGNNYRELVSNAVDAPGADGRAFVTEYAGASNVVDTATLDTTTYLSSAFEGIAVVDVVDTLADQELVSCQPGGCNYAHELVSSLLHEFVPVPEGLTDGEFYSCLSCFAGLIDPVAWDEAAFIDAYGERIVAPLRHAEDLLDTWPYITRLYTSISPNEMLSDPMFTENDQLEDVAARHGARREQACCGNAMRLPGERVVWLDGNGWPAWSDAMPWAEIVEEYAAVGGAPIVLSDQTATIDALLQQWNDATACEDPGAATTGVDDTSGPGGGPSVTSGDGGGATGSSGPTAGADDEQDVAGCGCRAQSSGGLGWMALGLGLGLGAVRRRRLG